MGRTLKSNDFVGSLLRTTLIGFAMLSALAEIGDALSFGDDAYFIGWLVVLVVVTLSDRVDYRRPARRQQHMATGAQQGPGGSPGP